MLYTRDDAWPPSKEKDRLPVVEAMALRIAG